jgi:hypothetical protein
MSLLGSVPFQSAIPPKFSADRGLMNPDKVRNLRLIVSYFPWSGSSTEVHKSGIFAEGWVSCMYFLISAPLTLVGLRSTDANAYSSLPLSPTFKVALVN